MQHFKRKNAAMQNIFYFFVIEGQLASNKCPSRVTLSVALRPNLAFMTAFLKGLNLPYVLIKTGPIVETILNFFACKYVVVRKNN